MRIYHLNYTDIEGGAARAAYRIHHALRYANVDSTMIVEKASIDDWTVSCPNNAWHKGKTILRRKIGELPRKLLKTANPIIHSTATLPSGYVDFLNKSNADIIHLHWIGFETLSIRDISKLKKPIVWTLHDMWAFCGAEHYTNDFRWREGYHHDNRPKYETGIDINRWTWNRKRKHWKKPIQIITPSNWLADCARNSALMKEWPVEVIPNPINTKQWKRVNIENARELFGLPNKVPLILFGALGGTKDFRKGYDLLLNSLHNLRSENIRLELVIFGQLKPKNPPDLGFPVFYTGHLNDDISLRILYSAADIMVIPSRLDNLPNTGVEAQVCGTPVVAFNIGGLPDIVEHKRTGYLAKPFDTIDLAEGIKWTIAELKNNNFKNYIRKKAVEKFSNEVVAKKYITLYQSIIKNQFIS